MSMLLWLTLPFYDFAVGHVMSPAKTAEPIEMPFMGGGLG